ncbi:hypothetical protein GALMADRAFT_1341572, partial [Galerina marginata CBS 339.88]
MKMALPKDIPTLEAFGTKNHTRVNNVFCTEALLDQFIKCDIDSDQRPHLTDHFPIISVIDMDPVTVEHIPRRNYRATDWEAFTEHLKEGLEAMEAPREFEEGEVAEMEEARRSLEEVVQKSITQHVPMSKPTPYSKRWWTKDLAKAKAAAQKLARKSFRANQDREDPIHEEARKARNNYSELMKHTKADHWTEWMENLDESEVWTA